MKEPHSGPPKPKHGERTGTTCPVCGENVLRQEKFGRGGAREGYRLVCAKRGCPWQGQEK